MVFFIVVSIIEMLLIIILFNMMHDNDDYISKLELKLMQTEKQNDILLAVIENDDKIIKEMKEGKY